MAERQLTIKINALKRTVKELDSYRKEIEKEKERLQNLKASGADDSRIRQQTEVVHESEEMIPDTKGRIENMVRDLEKFLASHADDPTISEGKISEAETVITSAKAVL